MSHGGADERRLCLGRVVERLDQLTDERRDFVDIWALVDHHLLRVVSDEDVADAPLARPCSEVAADHHEVQTAQEMLAVGRIGIISDLADECHGVLVAAKGLRGVARGVERLCVLGDGDDIVQRCVVALDAVGPLHGTSAGHSPKQAMPATGLSQSITQAAPQIFDIGDRAVFLLV